MIYSLQTQLSLDVHIGGKTALELQGFGHFIQLGKTKRIDLIGNPRTRLPRWATSQHWEFEFRYFTPKLFNQNNQLGIKDLDLGQFNIKISSPERAILETLNLIPERQSFEEAYYLMLGLTTLRPKMIQKLLENCNSIKVKRIFLFLANYCNHTWVKEIDINNIYLGSGKRVIEKKGFLNKEFNITIPKGFSNLNGDNILEG